MFPDMLWWTSKWWVEDGGSAPKVMASVVWEAKETLLIDYPENGRTIIGEYYSNHLDHLDVKIR